MAVKKLIFNRSKWIKSYVTLKSSFTSSPLVSEEFKAVLSWEGEQEEVKILANTLKVDDPESFILESIIIDDETAKLKVTVISKSPSSLRSTVDDILTCLMAANSTLSSIKFSDQE